MLKLSTGQDSTLENWIKNCEMVFGSESRAVKYLKEKVKEAPNGLKEEVIVDETQLLYVLAKMEINDLEKETRE